MPQQQQVDIPVFLFTGFLEAGKTRFIKQVALTDPAFRSGERTLLMVCEEGEEEYDAEELKKQNVFVEIVEQEIDLSEKIMTYLLKKNNCKQVIIEMNGMWQLNSLYQNMPDAWAVYQEFFLVDSTTFLTYNNNMRSLVVDKLQSAEMVIFSRFTKDMDKMPFHKIVRGSSRRAQIVYEYTDGNVEEDMIEDPLPFDMDADIIEVKDEDFALWYRDITEEPKKWIGKTVRMKGIVVKNPRFEPGVYAFGRQIMTCCVQDIQYCSLVAIGKKDLALETQSWYEATLKIDFKFHKLYARKGPILNTVSIQRCAAPEQEVATFF